MILRNVTLASERQVLGLQEAPGNAPSRLAPERRVPPQLEAVPQQQPPAPVLNLEAVGQWLEQQSVQTRAACAQMLASELGALHLAAKAEGLELGREQALREIRERATSSLNALAGVVTAAESAFALEAAQLAQDCADIVAEVFAKLAGSQLATREAALRACRAR